MSKTQISQFVKDPENLRLFEQERLILDVTEQVCEMMDDREVNRVQLAAAMQKSKGYISQLLDGSANMTLRTMADVFLTLGMRACVHAKPLHSCHEGRLIVMHDEPSMNRWSSQWSPNTEEHLSYSDSGSLSDCDVLVA